MDAVSLNKNPIFKSAEDGTEHEIAPVKREVYQGFETVPVTRVVDSADTFVTADGEEWHGSDVKYGHITRPKVVASRRAIPLRLAWWMTIHKSQGMSLSHVHAHVSRCFAPGQLYTALSRCRSLKGLTTSEIKSFSVSPKVKEYYARRN